MRTDSTTTPYVLAFVASSDNRKLKPGGVVWRWQSSYPGVGLVEQGDQLWLMIPESYRVGHEAHFGEVTKQFLGYLAEPSRLPAWEKPNMLAKYTVTTEGIAASRRSGTIEKRP